MKLEYVHRSLMLHNAHRLLRTKYKRSPLWAFVLDMCGTGSTSACNICRELGWDPDQPCNKDLPPWKPE